MGIETSEETKQTTAEIRVENNGGNAAEVRPISKRNRFTALYNSFRESGLSKLDSAFNALYICQSNRLCSRKIDVNDVGNGFFSHPAGWFKEREERIRRSHSTFTLRSLELAAKLLSRFSTSVESTRKRYGFFTENSAAAVGQALRSYKKVVPACLAVICAGLLFATVYINAEKDRVVAVYVDGVYVGEVSTPKTVDEALLRLNTRISSVTGEAFSFPHEISYSLKKSFSPEYMDIDGVYSLLSEYTEGYLTQGYGLYIDSKLVAVLDNRDDILEVLNTVKSEHMALTGEEEDIANSVEIRYQEYSPDSVIDREALLSMFTVEETVEASEPVVFRESLLAAPTTLTTLTLEGATPEIQQQLISAMESSTDGAVVLDFEVYYEETVRETAPFEIEYVEDDNYFRGQELIQTAGRNGTADNTYRVKYINGQEAGRELISQTFIRKPRTQIVRVGTRVLPEKLSEKENGGKYMINPVPSATVSDRFGWRVLRGRRDYHEGFDLAAWKGTPILAAASGEVIYAGYSQSYGYHVKIRHADGLISLYAHCSELLVETGDTVSQADKIGLVGSTGDSTGYHLHLEVIKDGEKVDPELYIYE